MEKESQTQFGEFRTPDEDAQYRYARSEAKPEPVDLKKLEIELAAKKKIKDAEAAKKRRAYDQMTPEEREETRRKNRGE